MHPKRKWLALLNVLGGSAVLLSYVYAFALTPELRTGLWGGVPESWRGVYTVSMFAAATGYFPFTSLFLFGVDPDHWRAGARARYSTLYVFYAAVLVASALWLPLTAQMLSAPSDATWVMVRLVLAVVAVGALGIVWSTWSTARACGGAWAWSAFVGALLFAWQTVVLDAIVWPAYF
jgi:hypothetical protein